MLKKSRIQLLISILIIVCTMVLIAAEPRKTPLPSLEEGLFWVTETHCIENVSMVDNGLEELCDRMYYHKWHVEGDEDVDGDICWKISITPVNIPENVKNDAQDEHLYSLYFRKSDLSIKKVSASIRTGRFMVSGEVTSKPSITFENHGPALLSSIPAYVPLATCPMIDSWHTRGMLEEKKEIRCVEERTERTIIQRIEPLSLERTGERYPALLVSLTQKDEGIQTFLWDCRFPWWSEYWKSSANGKRLGIWYSRVIEWNGVQTKTQR